MESELPEPQDSSVNQIPHPQDMPHYGSNMPWPPGQVNPPPSRQDGQRDPPPLGHIVNKTPSPLQDKKVPVAHPPWG